ncbi:uncharacterized protein LOC126819233 [Patella vulgata]|uniref:uncharacterized protein LOC126819233 n=1 Tax=Patella vulgata TaxID=6465 RepID=UPI00217FFBA8|nr:uncharacterized protein LOC126819233 [Patella vulgata]
MSRLNNDLLKLAKHVSDKLDNPSDTESIGLLDFDFRSDGKSERQLPTSTAPVDNFIKPKLLPPKSKKTIVCLNHKMSSSEKQSSDESDQDERIPEDKNKVNEVEKIPRGTSTNYIVGSGNGMEEVIIENSSILPIDDLSDEDELWLIIAPQEYNVKKQHVDMTCRQQLKGGKFEIQFFSQTGNENKMMTLLSDKNQFINGPSFKGCCQISERLQTFSPVYHDSVAKENPIPEGLKKRYIPFGANVIENGFEKDKKGGILSKRSSKRKHETESKVGGKNLAKKQDSEPSSASPIKKKKKKRDHVDS